jgi:hypothetical protein
MQKFKKIALMTAIALAIFTTHAETCVKWLGPCKKTKDCCGKLTCKEFMNDPSWLLCQW